MALMTKTWTLAEYHQVVDAGVLDDQPSGVARRRDLYVRSHFEGGASGHR